MQQSHLNIKFPKRQSDSYRIVIQQYVAKFNLRLNNTDILILSTVFDVNSRELNKILQKIALMTDLYTTKSTVMAFIYLAMEQKSMNPSGMSEKYFLDKFIELLVKYNKSLRTFKLNTYDYDNLANFANQFGLNLASSESGLHCLLKYYYLEYQNEPLSQIDNQLKEDLKMELKVSSDYMKKDLVKSWDNYINSGFIIN